MYLAAQNINIDVQDCIYVGDHPRDIDAGRDAQMYTILVAYGYLPLQYKDDLTAWRADCIVNTVSELLRYFDNWLSHLKQSISYHHNKIKNTIKRGGLL